MSHPHAEVLGSGLCRGETMGPTSSELRVSYTGRLPKSALRPNKQVRGALITVVFPAPWQREYEGKTDGGRGEMFKPPASPGEAGEEILPGKRKVRLSVCSGANHQLRQLHFCELGRDWAGRIKLSVFSGGFDYPFPISNLLTG